MRYMLPHLIWERDLAPVRVNRFAAPVIVALISRMDLLLLSGFLIFDGVDNFVHFRNILSHGFQRNSWFLSRGQPDLVRGALFLLAPGALSVFKYLLVFLYHLVVLLDLFLDSLCHFVFLLIVRGVFEN